MSDSPSLPSQADIDRLVGFDAACENCIVAVAIGWSHIYDLAILTGIDVKDLLGLIESADGVADFTRLVKEWRAAQPLPKGILSAEDINDETT